MALTAPKTWADGDAMSAAVLNTHIRDAVRWVAGHSDNPKPHCILSNTNPWSLTSGTFTAVGYDTVVVNRGGLFTSGTDVVITQNGVYHCSGWVEIESAACNKDVAIYLNGTDVVDEANQYGVGTPAVGRLSVDGYVKCVVGDVLTLEVFQDLGSTIAAQPYQFAVCMYATSL